MACGRVAAPPSVVAQPRVTWGPIRPSGSRYATETLRTRGSLMPATYTIDPTRRLVIVRAYGDLTGEELVAYYARLKRDPAFDPSFRQLSDFREVTHISAPAATVAVVAAGKTFAPGTRRAIVAPSNAAYGVARMFGIYAEAAGQVVEAFRDLPAAEAWLGL